MKIHWEAIVSSYDPTTITGELDVSEGMTLENINNRVKEKIFKQLCENNNLGWAWHPVLSFPEKPVEQDLTPFKAQK